MALHRNKWEDRMAEWRLKHFYHTIVNAKNVDETVAFYEMLGFQIISDRRDAVWPKGSGKSFALIPDTVGKGVLMVLPSDPDGPMMDIIEWVEPKAHFPGAFAHHDSARDRVPHRECARGASAAESQRREIHHRRTHLDPRSRHHGLRHRL